MSGLPRADVSKVEPRSRLLVQHRHPLWANRVRSRARSHRGVAIVEAAFITPVFFALILGIFEAGLYMKDYLAMSNSVRAGARSASAGGANALSDMYTIIDIDNESAALGGDQLGYIVVYKATGPGAGPTDVGGPQGGCKSGIPVTGVCNVYDDDDILKARAQAKELADQAAAAEAGISRTLDESKMWFGCVTSGPNANQSPDRFWCPGERKDARSDNNQAGPDYVGVWMKVNHAWVTRMFGTNSTMTDQSVIQIEPRSE
jgi:hypothetical protein